MKNCLTTLALLAVLAPASTRAQAAPARPQDVQPGLWELTNKVSSSNPQVQAAMTGVERQLANMTPEQRLSVQQMLEHNGVQVDLGAGGALHSKMCVTREMIARREMPMQEGDCAYKMTPAGANRLEVAFTCTRPHASGEGEMTVDTPTSYHGRMQVRNQEQPGQSVDMEVNGRWLGAECGSLRPIRMPAAQ